MKVSKNMLLVGAKFSSLALLNEFAGDYWWLQKDQITVEFYNLRIIFSWIGNVPEKITKVEVLEKKDDGGGT